jgi:hypothetical protein
MIYKAYPDFHVAVADAVVEGNTAASIERVTGTWAGRHRARTTISRELLSLPAPAA